MTNWRGIVRERWGTMRTAGALLHPHLVRVRMRGKHVFRRYARPLFEGYVQSLAPHVTVIPYTEMLDMLDIQPADVRVALPRLEGYVGLSDWERVTMATLARHYARRPVFEIGTAAGSTTLLLAQNTQQAVYTLDLPSDGADNVFALPRMDSDDRVLAGRRRGAMIQSLGMSDGRSRIVQLLGDSATFDFGPYRERIGLFFVDGAHSYEYVRSDTINAGRCCRADGIVVWHDFGSSREVSRWLNDLAGAGVDIRGIQGTTIAVSRDIVAIRNVGRRVAA